MGLSMHATTDSRRAILVNGQAYRAAGRVSGFNPPAPSYKAEVLHTLASAVALGLFVVGGLMMLVAVSS